jgi:hypothetical protein
MLSEVMGCNLGRTDRTLRLILGVGIGITGILINGHLLLGRLLGVAGALVLLSAGWGT